MTSVRVAACNYWYNGNSLFMLHLVVFFSLRLNTSLRFGPSLCPCLREGLSGYPTEGQPLLSILKHIPGTTFGDILFPLVNIVETLFRRNRIYSFHKYIYYG